MLHRNLILICFFLSTSCSFLAKEEIQAPIQEGVNATEEEEPSVQAILREELSTAREEIKTDLREIILEEILPELWTAQHNKEDLKIKDTQKRALRSAKEKTFIGRIEWVSFKEPEFSLQARIDTGAKTCSMHAENVRETQVNGEPYVQFETLDDEGKRHTMVRKVVARTKVKNTSGKISSRYVVRLSVKIGKETHDVNVNLNDREKMTYNFLVGRNLLLGNYLVDVSESHLLGDKL